MPPPRTASISRRCDEPFGAVRLALGPSCQIALAFIVAAECRPSQGGAQTNATRPSPREYPSARASNEWQRPRADSMPAMENASWIPGSSTPAVATHAWSHSVRRNAVAAR